MKIDPQLKSELKKYLLEKMQQERVVHIVSPYLLSENEMSKLKNNFAMLKDARIENEVDKSLVAGVVIKFGSQMIDLSIKGELQELSNLVTK
jgi:F-type H+-transporting ATPase subunit delta